MKIEKVVVIVLFLAVIISLPILTIMDEKKVFSSAEQRELATFPTYSKEGLFDGSYVGQLETYVLDHIYRRSDWMKGHVAYQMYALRRDVINNIVITDDFLLTYSAPNAGSYDYLNETSDEIASRFKLINELSKSYGGTFLYVGIPDQYSMLRDYYPKHIYNNHRLLDAIETKFFNALSNHDVPFINMREAFLAQDDYTQYYLKGDHHYNLYGAIFTCQNITERLHEMGVDVSIKWPEKDEIREVPNPFEGSRTRRLSFLPPVTDKLSVFDYTVPFKRWDIGAEVPSTIMDIPENDKEIVRYANYMSGDQAATIIHTNRPELPNVLIFGDSFTNALESFLYTGFNYMYSLDLRFLKDLSILGYIEENKPDIIICVINDTFYLIEDGNNNIY